MTRLHCALLDPYHEECDALVAGFDFHMMQESFLALSEHTKRHFAHEESIMKMHDFYGLYEHQEEHHKILTEMEYFYAMLEKGRSAFAKNYIEHALSERLENHIRMIDSQLAMFLKQKVLC